MTGSIHGRMACGRVINFQVVKAMYKLGKSCTHDKVNNTFTVDNIVLSAEQAEAIAMAWMNRDCKQNEQLCEIDKMQVWSSDPRVQRFT